MKSFKSLVLLGMAAATLQMNAFGQTNGIVVLGGDDLNDHGSRNGSGQNVTGWLYMENVLRSMAPQVKRVGPFTTDVAVLGSASEPVTGSGGGAAIASAALNAGMTVAFFDGPSAISTFFAGLANGTINPKIIHLPGDGVGNSLDSSEEAVLASNAQAINGFVASGGGLFSNWGEYTWLSALLPGITLNGACNSSTLTFTAAGTAFLPSLTVTDIRSGPCHGNFRGNLGALQILVQDGSGNAVVIGGVPVGGGGITGGSHSIPCFSGPITTDQPVHFQFTSALTAPVHFTMTPGNIANGLTLTSAGLLNGTPRAAGTFLYTIAAGGAGGATDHIQCSLQVNPPPPPAATLTITSACPLPTGVVGSAYSQTLSTSGGTAPITLSLSSGSLPAGLTLTAGVISGTPTGAGTATFTLLATDSANPAQTATKSCSIAVSATPVQPTITSACPAGPGTVNVAYHANLSATGDLPITWSIAAGTLPTGVLLHSNGSVSGIPHHAGTFNYTLRASNAAGSATQACSLVINDPNAPPPPPPATLTISTACPLNSGVVGTAFSQALTTTGGTGAVTYSISSGALPAGLTLSGSTISGTPSTAATASFTIQAVDSGSPTAQTATKSCSMTINAAPTAPVITTACPLTQGVVGQAYHLNLAATGTSPISWSITNGNLPIGMALFSSGLLTGVPHHDGTFNFTIQASNSVTSVTQACSLVILLHAPPPPPPGPAITACPASSAVIGTAYSQTLSTTGTSPITLSIQSGSLPAGLTLTGNTISGTPTGAAGTSNFTLLATDSGNPVQTGTRACSIAVSAAPPAPLGPTITTACPLPSGLVGTPVHINLTATGDSPITWSITNGTLPLGISLTSTGTLTGVPHHDGTFQFTLRAANNTGSALRTCTWAIGLHSIPGPAGSPTAPSITTGCPLPQGTVGSAYSQSFSTTGGTPPFTYAITAGAVPAGLSLSSGGTLSGTPSAQGTANFTVTVTDTSGPSQTNSLACSVVINAAPIVPPAAVAPTITTACPLPNAVVGTAYSLTLAASGGATPYTFALAAGALPTPLTLSSGGVISGAPLHHGSYHFTFRVTGSDGATSLKSCTMTVQQHGSVSASRGAIRYGAEDSKGVVPMTFELDEALPFDVTGRIFMVARRFVGEESDLVGFNTGGREADFMIKAGDTTAQFIVNNFGAQVGDRGAEMVLMVVLEGGDNKIVIDLSGTERVPTRADQ